jgi:CheY-like chemotaxis protein
VLEWPGLTVVEPDVAIWQKVCETLPRNLQRCPPLPNAAVYGNESAALLRERLDSTAFLLLFAAGMVLAGSTFCLAIVKSDTDRPLTILCADDHTLVGDAVTKVFVTAGYVVERASDGEEAWARLAPKPSRFDVVITDHRMPRMGGLQLVGRLRDAKYRGRIIVYGAALGDADVALYREMGVEAMVIENADAAQLLGVVKALHRQE